MPSWQEADLRSEFIDSAVKAVNMDQAKMKFLAVIDSSSAWTETYFRETNGDQVDGGTGSSIRGIPQMAPFPGMVVDEVKVSSVVQKYGNESVISLEMQQRATVPMLQRHILRQARKINWQIDVAVNALLSADAGQTYAIGAGNEWDSATVANRDPIFDILSSINLLRGVGVDALNGNGFLVVNGTDYTNIISNSKILNHPTFKTVSAVQNGVVNELAGLRIMVAEAVTADQAYIVVKGESLVWKQAQALQVVTMTDPGKSTTIRAWEFGVAQLHAPNGVCKLTNTRA